MPFSAVDEDSPSLDNSAHAIYFNIKLFDINIALMTNMRNNVHRTLSMNTFVKLMRATESVSSDVHHHLAQHDLTISQFGILEALFHLGPMTQKMVARKILRSPGNITMVVDNLEKRGLVTRRKNPDDRRSFIIELTGKGEACIASIFPDHADRIQNRMSRLTDNELEQLGRLLRKLGTPQQNFNTNEPS